MPQTTSQPPPGLNTRTPEHPNTLRPFVLDGRPPDLVAEPETEEACAEMVRGSAAQRVALVPFGGATTVQTGNLLQAKTWCALSTAKLRGIVDFSAADLTVTARAGTTLAELAEALASSGQWLPYDVVDPARATIGGLVAANRQGLLRSAFGAPRDRVLGLRVVLADGSTVRAGGRTVKNVAGYDLTRLFAGSRGALGLITEVTIRTAALPPVREEMSFSAPTLEAAVIGAAAVRNARLDPLTLAVTGPTAPTVRVSLAGNPEGVAWQRAAITEVLAGHSLHPEDSAGHPWSGLAACPVQAHCAVQSSDVGLLVDGLCGMADAVVADAASGIVEAGFGAGPDLGVCRRTLRAALPEPGWVVWTRVPLSFKAEGDVWCPAPSDLGVMRAVKRALDADRVFSPGRLPGRL